MSKRIAYVATSGGHLTQLRTITEVAQGWPVGVWVTNSTAQSRSMLANQDVLYLPVRSPRAVLGVMKDAWSIRRVFKSRGITDCVSTGAQLALSSTLAAMTTRTRVTYIESATRSEGPSLTGRVLNLVPGVKRFVQYPTMQTARNHYRFTVFDLFAALPREPTQIRRLVVTLGANAQYGFRPLLERLLDLIPPDVEVQWQVGPTDVSGLGIDARPAMPYQELQEAIAAADVVVAHAGTGSALTALTNGKIPVLIPRDHRAGEHVDNHQEQLGRTLTSRNLAIVRTLKELRLEDLEAAAHLRAIRTAVTFDIQ